MANEALSALTATTALVSTDLLYAVDGANSRKITWANVIASISGLAASDVSTGSFANARISENSVTQHEAALTITESQISDLGGYVDTSGVPVLNDFARFTDANTIEGRSYAEVRADLSLEVGTDVQAYSAVLDATTASFTTADETKLDGIESGATADQSDAEIETAINNQLTGTVVGTTDTQTLTGKTINGDSNTLSNLDLGNEVDWAAIGDVTDRTAFASGDKILIFEAGVGMRKVDYDDLPGAGGGLSNIVEDTTPELGGDLDGKGLKIENYINEVVTSVTGTLTTTAHSGNIIKTSGNITVPTTAGFTCVIIAGGAHTVTFNATTSAAMATGDVMTVVVESATVIHAVLTAAADKVTFS